MRTASPRPRADHLPRRMVIAASLFAMLLATACSRDDDTDPMRTSGPVEALPQPLAADGAVTGMPENPGPGDVPLGGEPPAPPPLFAADERFGMPLLEDNPETGLGTTDTAANLPEPTPADAVALLQQYYGALGARDFAKAYGMWSDGGRASGLTPEQFAATFSQMTAVDAQPGEPRPAQAAAGSRVVEVPLLLRTTHGDGSVRTQAGRVVLRRAMVDGASAEQRAWRIASADLRDAVE